MSRNLFLKIIMPITVLVIIISIMLFGLENSANWLKREYINITITFFMAIVAGLIIEYSYSKYFKSKSKISQTTQIVKDTDRNKSFGKLILPNNNDIILNGAEVTLGREDFLGVIPRDDLIFIGKEHFRIKNENDGFYIKDLNTQNGTKLNSEELKGLKGKRLKDGDKIVVARTLYLKYYENPS